jgi:alpha-amylase/alpha-mannosidase (GH57 family)
MHPLYIAFIWHMHQPLYRDPLSHYYMMPWVRLHGVKDYLDMVTILKRYPRLHQTFNLVPSLLEQIEDYASGEASDRYLTLSQIPVAELSRAEKEEILLTFFDLNWDQMVSPYARYRELSEQRAHFFQLYQTYYQAADHFSEQDWLDLTTWFNLAWIDPALCEQEPVLQALKHKGRGFSADERRQVLEHHQLILQRILPAYRELSASGQIELTTSPYYHPILPLLSDSDSARFSSTGIDLPRQHFQHPDDAYAQLQMAHRASQHYFGKAPKGLWPSEQSLSPEVLPLIARTGFEWVASSEGILWNTLSCMPHRNSQHILDIAEYLYRPYRVTHQGAALNIVFRDTYLSDQIGFNYWRGDNERNAHQLYHQLKAIQQTLNHKEPYPYIVTIALDGENCWEYYRKDGQVFLNTLYTLLQKDTSLECVTVSEYLEKHPPQDELTYLHPGSWINSDFRTWIGDPTKNLAWDYLKQTRDRLVAKQDGMNPDARAKAWESIYIAEGSDWFWWFGEGHSSNHDHLFDEAFRVYLSEVYRLIGEDVPEGLTQPLEDQVRSRMHDYHHIHHSPISTMQPSSDYYQNVPNEG